MRNFIIYQHDCNGLLLHKKIFFAESVNFLIVARGTALAAALMACHKASFD